MSTQQQTRSQSIGASPEKGDIWEDLTPHYHRFVRVARVGPSQALIHRVEKLPASGNWVRAYRAPDRFTNLTRFNGKSGGFKLHHREVLT